MLAITAAGYLFMLATGLVLWWPVRWRHAFSVRRNAGSLASRRWSELDAGTRAFSDVYPLHTGTLGGAAAQAGSLPAPHRPSNYRLPNST